MSWFFRTLSTAVSEFEGRGFDCETKPDGMSQAKLLLEDLASIFIIFSMVSPKLKGRGQPPLWVRAFTLQKNLTKKNLSKITVKIQYIVEKFFSLHI